MVNDASVRSSRPTGGGVYIDTWQLLATPSKGRYADYLRDAHGRLVLMRSSDGVHFAPAAGDLIARDLLERLRARYELMGDGID